jgi:hypothetical protein
MEKRTTGRQRDSGKGLGVFSDALHPGLIDRKLQSYAADPRSISPFGHAHETGMNPAATRSNEGI